jgi:carbon-monoxide dehydrogenase small subunit
LTHQSAEYFSMTNTYAISVTVNGTTYQRSVEPRLLLSDFLRHELNLTGTHVGCEHGSCGACTVLLQPAAENGADAENKPAAENGADAENKPAAENGADAKNKPAAESGTDAERKPAAVRSCILFAVQVDGHVITTVEGLAPGGEPENLHPIQQAFWEKHGLQCGYCTPGFLLTLIPFLEENPDPSEEEIRSALSGNLCRCTGYQNIVDAALLAAEMLRTSA